MNDGAVPFPGEPALNDLDPLYLNLLHFGLVAIRNASAAGDLARCHAEAELLHQIPTLFGETNVHRHVYHATKGRKAYLE